MEANLLAFILFLLAGVMVGVGAVLFPLLIWLTWQSRKQEDALAYEETIHIAPQKPGNRFYVLLTSISVGMLLCLCMMTIPLTMGLAFTSSAIGGIIAGETDETPTATAKKEVKTPAVTQIQSEEALINATETPFMDTFENDATLSQPLPLSVTVTITPTPTIGTAVFKGTPPPPDDNLPPPDDNSPPAEDDLSPPEDNLGPPEDNLGPPNEELPPPDNPEDEFP